MSDNNIQVVQDIYAAFIRGDVPGIMQHISDDLKASATGSRLTAGAAENQRRKRLKTGATWRVPKDHLLAHLIPCQKLIISACRTSCGLNR
jgi:ketosteroid isomerase-like protein